MQSILAQIDLKQIQANARYLMRKTNRPLFAVVKDDAYGHGAVEVANTLETIVAGFAVANVGEGCALRSAGVKKDILVLTPPLDKAEVLKINYYDLTASVGSLHTMNLCKGSGGLRAHVAINTGMNRYGVRPDRVKYLCRKANEYGICFTGVYSHLYAAENEKSRAEQIALFTKAQNCVKSFFPLAVAHLGATGGALAGVCFDAVRCGLGLYGYCPDGFSDRAIKPAMKLYATVADTRIAFGGGVGYQCAERAYGTLHTLRLGYGDGFFREGGLGIGKLCMDAYIAEGRAKVGSRKRIVRDLQAYAAAHGTSVYEVLVNIGTRAVREYLNETVHTKAK